VSNVSNQVAVGNLSKESRARFFAWCFAAVFVVAAIDAIAQVAS
jgi:hypothetical protein